MRFCWSLRWVNIFLTKKNLIIAYTDCLYIYAKINSFYLYLLSKKSRMGQTNGGGSGSWRN